MKTGLIKIALGFLLMALSCAVFADDGTSSSHDVSALASHDGETSLSRGVAAVNSENEAFWDASIRFKEPTDPIDTSAASASFGALPGVDHTFENFRRTRNIDVPMSSQRHTGSGRTQQAVRSGADLLKLIQTVPFNPEDLYVTICIVMTNTGTSHLHSVEYMGHMDQNPEQPWTTNHTAHRWVGF